MNKNQQAGVNDPSNSSKNTLLSQNQHSDKQSESKNKESYSQAATSLEGGQKTMSPHKESDLEALPLQSAAKPSSAFDEQADTTFTKKDTIETSKIMVPTPKTRSVASNDDDKQKPLQKCSCNSAGMPADLDVENDWRAYEQDSNELPLPTIVKIGNMKKKGDFYSSESETSQPKTKKSKHQEKEQYLGDSFLSQESEEGHRPMNCNHCSLLRESNCKMKAEKNQYMTQINSLKQQCSELSLSKKQAQCRAQDSSDYDECQPKPNVFSEKLLKKMIRLHRHICKIKQAGFQEVVSLAPDQEIIIPELLKDLKFLMRYIGKSDKAVQEERFIVSKLHEHYKKTIEDMKKYYQEKLAKADADMKNFMKNLVIYEKKRILHQISSQAQEELHNRNLKKKVQSLYISTEDFKEDEQIQSLRERIETLTMNLKDEKKKAKTFENSYKHLFQKYSKEIVDLGKQKSSLLRTVKRYELEFEVFMQKITNNSSLTNQTSKKLFTSISQRIFEISNCIPFEDNDEQNLFAADNEQELYDMIERIRRFALKLQDYRNQKDLNQHKLKNNISTLFKKLIMVDKIPLNKVLNAVKANQQLNLDFLKDYLLCVRQKLQKTEQASRTEKAIKPLKFKKSFSLQKIEGFKYGN